MELKRSRDLKKAAKLRLGDCWCECVGIFFVSAAIIAVGILSGMLLIQFLYTYDIISYEIHNMFFDGGIQFYASVFIGAVVLWILTIPLRYGINWYYMQAIKGKNVPASCFFSCYMHPKHFIKTILVGLNVFLRKLVFALPIIAIGAVEVILAAKAVSKTTEAVFYSVVICCLVLLLTCMLFFYMVFSMKYMLVPYLYSLNPQRSIKGLINDSKAIMYGRESNMLEVIFSFSGWILLCIFIFPTVYVVPYIYMTFSSAANDFIDNYNNEQKNIKALKKSSERYCPAREEDAFV